MLVARENSEPRGLKFHTRHLFIGAFVLVLLWLAPRGWAEEGYDLPIRTLTGAAEIPPGDRPVEPTMPPIFPMPDPCIGCKPKAPPPETPEPGKPPLPKPPNPTTGRAPPIK